jgi:peptidoglycan/xylan/chitin deacetylase (PgdA/CDA1 family)
VPRRAPISFAAALAALALAVAASGCGSTATPPRGASVATTPGQIANGPVAPGVPAGGVSGPDITRLHHGLAPVPVLMYHVIATAPPGARYGGLWVPPATLRAQVAALAGAGFQAVTLDAVLNAWGGEDTLPPHPVVLSFDDGYLSQGRTAGAILARHGWSGVLNLVWHNLGAPGGLTRTRVRELIAAGWEIDAHSLTHPDLTTLDAATVKREVAGSRDAIHKAFGVPVDAFCYPAGRFDPAVEAAVRAAGYRAATSELPGAATPTQDRFALSRIRVDAGDGAATVLARVRAASGASR